mgnify:FL=1
MTKGIIFILTLGVFSIINTEMGVVGILPLVAEEYGVTVATAGLLVSLFALIVAFAGPTMPLLFSRINRKKTMLLVLGVFTGCNLISAFATTFPVVVAARVIPAFFQPVYVSMAMSVAGASVSKEEAPKAVSKVMIGVSAGMVLGVPIVSYIANVTSLRMGMLFFAAVNAVALIATVIVVPDLPVKEKLSYGSQLSVLKEGRVWLAILGVMCLNGSIFGMYSYLSDYLENVTHLSSGIVSALLLVYGLSNILGNVIAGRALSSRPLGFVLVFPPLLIAVYAVLFFLGAFTVPMAVLTLVWGVLAGCAANINQYWLATAAPHAPDFANGLFLASTNLGTTLATTVCGFFLSSMGTQFIVLGGALFLVCALGLIVLRVQMDKHAGNEIRSQLT